MNRVQIIAAGLLLGALWANVIFLGDMIAMPIYWYLYIWKEAAVASSPLPGQLNSANSSTEFQSPLPGTLASQLRRSTRSL